MNPLFSLEDFVQKLVNVRLLVKPMHEGETHVGGCDLAFFFFFNLVVADVLKWHVRHDKADFFPRDVTVRVEVEPSLKMSLPTGLNLTFRK